MLLERFTNFLMIINLRNVTSTFVVFTYSFDKITVFSRKFTSGALFFDKMSVTSSAISSRWIIFYLLFYTFQNKNFFSNIQFSQIVCCCLLLLIMLSVHDLYITKDKQQTTNSNIEKCV